MMSRRWRSRFERKMKDCPLMMTMVVVRVRVQAVERDSGWRVIGCGVVNVGSRKGMSVVIVDGQTTTVDDSRRERSGGWLVRDERESKQHGRERRERKRKNK